MVSIILITLYILGIPLTFWLMGGHTDFEPCEEETVAEKHDRYLSIMITFTMTLIWPFFWALVILVFIVNHLLPRFLS